MKDENSLDSRWTKLFNKGKLDKKCSFLAANIECDIFGAVRVPASFHDRYGDFLPSQLGIRCKKYLWPAKYDKAVRKIYDIGKFMRYYGLTVYNVALFEYYGDGLFEVQIFRDTAVECLYPKMHPTEFFKTTGKYYDEEDYILDTKSLELEKQLSLLCFNACANKTDFVEMCLSEQNLNPHLQNLELDPSWEKFYNKWDDGSKVVLRLERTYWEVFVSWQNNRCSFGRGWVDFARESGLQAGDNLLLFKHNTDEENILNFCIFKAEAWSDACVEGTSNAEHSFYKMVYPHAAKEGHFVLPRLFSKKYCSRLCRIRQVDVDDRSWYIFYNVPNGYIYNLEDMLKHFKVIEKEAIVFSMNSSNVMTARIFQKDGMEIAYKRRIRSAKYLGDEHWFIKPDLRSDYDLEEDSEHGSESSGGNAGVGNDMAENDLQFTITVSTLLIDKKTHGPFIPVVIHPPNRAWKKGDEVEIRTEKGSWRLGMVLHGNRARMSAGWNKFARDNEYQVDDVLSWQLIEENGTDVFIVTKVAPV
nr:PREDICTED: uncharacterized protein LOC108227556 [Daucus carota subsp. sativus]